MRIDWEPGTENSNNFSRGEEPEIVCNELDNIIWIPATAMYLSDGAEFTTLPDLYAMYCVARLDAIMEGVGFNFHVPAGAAEVVEAKLIYFAVSSLANADGFDAYAAFGALGESCIIHMDSVEGIGAGSVVENQIYEVDISGALTGIAAGDYCGIRIRVAGGDAIADRAIIGFRLRWK